MSETTPTNQNQSRRSAIAFSNGTFWTAIAILILLLLFSAVILSIQLHSFATIEERVLSLKSNMETRFDVFSLKYKNASGEVTVIGTDGEKIVAPGTDVEYSVRLRNADRVALNYEICPSVAFHSSHNIPLHVRVIGPDETYIVGDAKTWAPMEALNGSSDTATLIPGESVEYVFQWKWLYESGNDDYDTFLGDHVYREDIGVTVSFDTYAAENVDYEINDGVRGNLYGPMIFLLIFVLMLLVAIIILLIYKLCKKRGYIPPKETVDPASVDSQQ